MFYVRHRLCIYRAKSRTAPSLLRKKELPEKQRKKLPLCGKKKGGKNFGCKAAKKYFIAFLIDNAHYDRCLVQQKRQFLINAVNRG